MHSGMGIVCGLALIGTATVAAFQVGPKGPPDIEQGKIVAVDWKGTGLASGEILQVNGSWVKLRFTSTEKAAPGDAGASISAAVDAWVNFDKLSYYMAPRQKK
jgi:hypothetical protein